MPFERRGLGDDVFALVSTALEADGVLAAFVERTGGTSVGRYASLNVSYRSGDDRDAVAANRSLGAAASGVEAFAVPGLVHGTRVARVEPSTGREGFDRAPGAFRDADTLWTDRPGVALGAFSADCVIAVLSSAREGRLVMAHAGWRGLAAGALRRASAVFDHPADVRAALGPAIGPCHYEVGYEVVTAVADAAPVGDLAERRRGRWFLDLVGAARATLQDVGVGEVADTGVCTACEASRFFSHRRDGVTGRHLAVAVRRSAHRDPYPRCVSKVNVVRRPSTSVHR